MTTREMIGLLEKVKTTEESGVTTIRIDNVYAVLNALRADRDFIENLMTKGLSPEEQAEADAAFASEQKLKDMLSQIKMSQVEGFYGGIWNKEEQAIWDNLPVKGI